MSLLNYASVWSSLLVILRLRCKVCCIFRFREKYEHPILRGNDKRASERDKRVGSMVAKVMPILHV